jgi:lipoprotein-anchoring transpeptidase ErfK/SrfK
MRGFLMNTRVYIKRMEPSRTDDRLDRPAIAGEGAARQNIACPTADNKLSRRAIVLGLPLLIAGCNASQQYGSLYGPSTNEPYMLPALDLSTLDPDLLRREVSYRGPYRPGTVVVNIAERRLYLVQSGGQALRYAVGVGREEALNFRGSAIIGRKAVWPGWTPTESMMQRIPRYREYAGGMPGGLDSPLGARALYLYRGGQDTHFRLHGTIEPETIGTAVSSGCIRLFNQDIIDLYNRVPLGAPVVVLQG